MILLATTLPSPSQNLAFDEALVEVADRSSGSDLGIIFPEVLRLWEMPSTCVVLGRSSKWTEEVNAAACRRDEVPVLRRASGGASIVAGAGCLMYSVLISYESRPAWRMIDVAHVEVMGRIRNAVQQTMNTYELHDSIDFKGTCDLTINNRKFSGNALRCKRNWMLYHGTIVYSMPIEWINTYLHQPSRQPEYRENRNHNLFVTRLLATNTTIPPKQFRASLEENLGAVWSAEPDPNQTIWKKEVDEETKRLMQSKYSDPNWHTHR